MGVAVMSVVDNCNYSIFSCCVVIDGNIVDHDDNDSVVVLAAAAAAAAFWMSLSPMLASVPVSCGCLRLLALVQASCRFYFYCCFHYCRFGLCCVIVYNSAAQYIALILSC